MRIKMLLIANFVLQKPFGKTINDVGRIGNGQLELCNLKVREIEN